MAANLTSLFGEAASLKPVECMNKLLECIQGPEVTTVLYHTNYELPMYALLETAEHGFGQFCYHRTGERLFVRVRSYFGTTLVANRALEPIEIGERREITCLVTSIGNPLKEGSVKIIVAEWIPPKTIYEVRYGRPKPHALAPSQSVNAISIAPFVLLDSYVTNDKSVSIGQYAALWSGSTTIVERYGFSAENPHKIRLDRGIANQALAEWCVNIEKRSKVDLSIVVEMSMPTWETIAAKSMKKIERVFETERNHPTKEEFLQEYPDAINLANHFFEHGTLCAFLDLIARGTFDGIGLTVFNSPTKFPLYISACVFLAVFPELARLHSSPNAQAEERANAQALLETYRSLTTGVDFWNAAALDGNGGALGGGV